VTGGNLTLSSHRKHAAGWGGEGSEECGLILGTVVALLCKNNFLWIRGALKE
jgi:hypothetical protein